MIFTQTDLDAITLTLKLACISTLVLLILAMPLAWWLARSQWRFKFVIEAMVALPLVLPPTVLGFYLLIAFSPTSVVGGLLNAVNGSPLAFTFTGLVIGSVVYSLPFVVQPLHNAFVSIDIRSMEAAATLRAGPLDRFLNVALPLAKPGLITAAVLGFAHTIGEFGVVLMIGGNIPGETQVASITIYEHVDSLDYASAHRLAASLLVLSFILLTVVYANNRRTKVLRF